MKMIPSIDIRSIAARSKAKCGTLVPAFATGIERISASCEGCHRSLMLRHLSDRKAGIRMGQSWYCGSRCFTRAAEEQFSRELASVPAQTSHVSRMPLTLILISRGWLTNEQSQQVLLVIQEQKQAEEDPEELGDLLVRLGYVSEKQVTAARATQWGCPVFAVQNRELQTGVHIPRTLIRRYSVLPLHYAVATKRLLVGFVNRVEYGLLYTIEQMTDCKAEPCFVTPGDFRAQMEQMEQRERMEMAGDDANATELMFDRVHSPAEMASLLCSHAVDREADEAFIGKSRDYLWARLCSGSQAVDLFFKIASTF